MKLNNHNRGDSIMYRLGILFIILWSQSLLAQKMENNPGPVYDAQLSGYQYDFEVNYPEDGLYLSSGQA